MPARSFPFSLNATWRSLSWITPSDLMPILAAVRATYGQDTALQGWIYRYMVYLFGIKQAQHLKHFEPQPHRFEQLQKALNEPSLYDDVLAFLSRRGFKIPAEVLTRNPSKTYASDPGVEKAWAAAYETDPPVKKLGETMTDIAEEITTWNRRGFSGSQGRRSHVHQRLAHSQFCEGRRSNGAQAPRHRRPLEQRLCRVQRDRGPPSWL